MRRKYIRKIFLGKIHPADSCGFENEEYEKGRPSLQSYTAKFKHCCRTTRRKCWSYYVRIMRYAQNAAHTAMQTEIVIDGFCNGFKLGANLIAESLYSTDK